MQVGLCDHLDQRHTAAVEVHNRTVDLVMQQLARVLLKMDALKAAGLLFSVHIEEHLAVFADRHIELRNLVGLGQVRIKIILAVGFAELVDRAAGRLAHLGRIVHNLLVEHRQRARHTGADRTGVSIDRRAERGRAGAVDLALSGKFRMHLKADDSLIFHLSFPPLQRRDDISKPRRLLKRKAGVQ